MFDLTGSGKLAWHTYDNAGLTVCLYDADCETIISERLYELPAGWTILAYRSHVLASL